MEIKKFEKKALEESPWISLNFPREIGRQLQQDERYLAMHRASEACDGDLELQNLIGEFNLKRMAINNESNQETPDEAKLQELNNDLRLIYTQVMQNENIAELQRCQAGSGCPAEPRECHHQPVRGRRRPRYRRLRGNRAAAATAAPAAAATEFSRAKWPTHRPHRRAQRFEKQHREHAGGCGCAGSVRMLFQSGLEATTWRISLP